MNANAPPFVPPWAKAQTAPAPTSQGSFNANAPAWTPTLPAGVPAASAAAHPAVAPAVPGAPGGVQPLFYDNGQMIRPHHQPHFFGVAGAPPLLQVQVGRSGTSSTAPLLPVYDPAVGATHQSPLVPSAPSHNKTVDVTGLSVASLVPRQTEDLHVLNMLAQLSRPVVILVLGGRGSGKTTQSIRIAAKYGLLRLCSGDIVRGGQQPLTVLENVLKHIVELQKQRQANATSSPSKSSGKASTAPAPAAAADTAAEQDQSAAAAAEEDPYPGAMRGLVLDRFISNADAEPYYLIELLHKYGMQLDLTVNLMMSYEVSVARADARDEKEAAENGSASKPKKDQRRLLEHLTVYNTCTIFREYGGLECIDVENLTLDQAEYEVQVRVDRTINGLKNGAAGSKRNKPKLPCLCAGITMCPSFSDYLEVRADVHATLGTPENKYSMAPFSLMTGIVDKVSLTTLRKFLPDYHVTWKADGDRVLVVRHAKYGYVAFNGKFANFFIIDPKLIPPQWNLMENMTFEGEYSNQLFAPAASFTPPHRVSFIFDTELIRGHNDKYRLYLFDVLYAGPQNIKGTVTNWAVRYNALKTICAGLSASNVWCFFALKEFVPCGNIRTLVSSAPPFPTDGIVFQHKGVYKVPHDTRIYKWKPRAQCSVDFRLSGGMEESQKRRWLFYPLSLRIERNAAPDEYAFKNAVIVVSDIVVEQQNLADGMVVECIKTDVTLDYDGITLEVWEFLRTRPDKAFPNNETIAKYIDEMEHLTQPEVVVFCEQACGTTPVAQASSATASHSQASRPSASTASYTSTTPATAPAAAAPTSRGGPTAGGAARPTSAAPAAPAAPQNNGTKSAALPPPSANAWSRGAPESAKPKPTEATAPSANGSDQQTQASGAAGRKPRGPAAAKR